MASVESANPNRSNVGVLLTLEAMMKAMNWMVAIGMLASACGGTDAPIEDETVVAAETRDGKSDASRRSAAAQNSTLSDTSVDTESAVADEAPTTGADVAPEETDPPLAECTPDECGPGLGAPNILCDDGSMGGPVCERAADGTCGWEIRECPTAECKPEECGAPIRPPIVECDDGSTGGPVCEHNEAGLCEWTVRECPVGCQPADCGPQPDWLTICPDGSELRPVCQEAAALATDASSLTDQAPSCDWILPTCR